ncbi:MAG: hypothetical protein H7Y17_07740 [Chlorobia bacterium]|nr:hypothetical protein [Fimbriimonadaceae bacterium]
MDAVPQLIRANTEAEWQAAWNYAPQVPKLIRQLAGSPKCSHRESLMRAAYFACGKLHSEDFHMFANGGQPLLKRQRGAWLDEIIFHCPPHQVPGQYSPVSVEIMMSFEPLREVRAKFSRSCAMVSTFLASVNIGEFMTPSARTIWNIESDGSTVKIANLLFSEGLDWIEDICNPVTLEDRVIAGTLPHVDDFTSLELVLAVGGRAGARRVVDEWKRDPLRGPNLERSMRKLSSQFGPVYRGDDMSTNTSVLCICYDLWTSRVLELDERAHRHHRSDHPKSARPQA